ncbi:MULTISPECIES: multidrug efflux SMR transporter [Halobacterium]|uniref:DMT family transporter n=1 Tax=Halobacterium TaxID=2239 RepID=UPI00073F57BC|nr:MULTISPECIES: multidrug efflux SMR transporter [Halobacterium]MCG1002732.1 multidrug efflux SMR transporter [Halobacterium noricense]
MNAYVYLASAIAAEIAGTAALKFSDGFSNPVASGVVVVAYLGSFYFLGRTLETLPVGLVYATWSAVGIVGAVGTGVVFFDERVDAAAVLGIALLLTGVFVLNVVSESYAPAH